MKLELALSLFAVTALAGTSQKTTKNECAEGEGVEGDPESCFDIYYAIGNCESYLVKPDDSCNAWAF